MTSAFFVGTENSGYVETTLGAHVLGYRHRNSVRSGSLSRATANSRFIAAYIAPRTSMKRGVCWGASTAIASTNMNAATATTRPLPRTSIVI